MHNHKMANMGATHRHWEEAKMEVTGEVTFKENYSGKEECETINQLLGGSYYQNNVILIYITNQIPSGQ